MENEPKGLRLLGACKYRRLGQRGFKPGNAVRWRHDSDGNETIEGRDERNEPFLLPNTPEFVRPRRD